MLQSGAHIKFAQFRATVKSIVSHALGISEIQSGYFGATVKSVVTDCFHPCSHGNGEQIFAPVKGVCADGFDGVGYGDVSYGVFLTETGNGNNGQAVD